MSYEIEKYKKGFRLVDNNGHYYSNKAMTKKAVISQMQAIKISKHKHKNHPLYPQYVRETGDLSGAGFGDWLKKTVSKVKDVASKAVSKVKDVASNVAGRVSGFVTGIRDDYQPKARDILKKYGNNKVIKLIVKRDPLQKALEIGINLLSVGQYQKSKEEAGYDSYYHLYMIATLDNNIELIIEKNEVINIDTYNKNSSVGDKFDVIMNEPIVLNTMLNKTKDEMGIKRFFYYDAFTDNCQIFINSIMANNELLQLNPDLEKFIMQDYRTLIKNVSPTTKKVMAGITNLGRRFNILIHGKGFTFPEHILDMLHGKGLIPQHIINYV